MVVANGQSLAHWWVATRPELWRFSIFPVESDFPDNLLYLRNYDKPGFIGDLGSLCGARGINIATFHLGRKQAGGEAIALVEIDGGMDPETLQELRGLKQVVRADFLTFSK